MGRKRQKPRVRKTEAPVVRRRFRSGAWAVGIVVALAAMGAVAFWKGTGPAPPAFVAGPDQNILLITIDTLRGDALGSYGGRAATPNLDGLAREGVRFTFAHAHAVVTLPSHASILTGRYPFEHGARDNAGYRVERSIRTLAEAAREKGFATGAFVGAFPLDRQFGLHRGFDVYDDVAGQEAVQADFLFTERPAADVVAAATNWIRQQQRPWLAWVHVFDPHSPYAPPAPFREQYRADPYAGEVAYTDSALGPLLQLARSSRRPTTIVVTADHGEGLGDHGERTHGIFAYESTLRIPLILAQTQPSASGAAERAASAGFVVDAPVRHVDILPTLGALTTLSLPDDLPGRSLLPLLDGESEDRPAYFEAMTGMLKRGWAPLRGVVVDREKYIDLPIEELYDLAADPNEERNLAATAGGRTRQLAAVLKGFGAELPGEQRTENAEARARLQALGYISGSAAIKQAYTEEDDPKRLIEIDRLMMEGIELHRAGRSAEGAEAYRRVIARRPDMSLAYRRLAYILWDMGNTREAIGALRETLAKNGPDIEVEARLATYLAETGKADEAIAILERTTTADPDNGDALNALGIAYAQAGRIAEARRAFEKLLAAEPRNAFAMENLGAVLMQRGDFAGAQGVFERAIAASPASSRAHAGLGAAASGQGRDREALEHWRRAVELDPRNFDALFNLATGLLRAGRVAEARPYVEQFVRAAPTSFYGREIEQLRRSLAGPG